MTQQRLTLVCPLSRARIRIPARGAHCQHKTCFDLASFFKYSDQQGFWECPICNKPLPAYEVVIDQAMRSILARTDYEDRAVLVSSDGTLTRCKEEPGSSQHVVVDEDGNESGRAVGAKRPRSVRQDGTSSSTAFVVSGDHDDDDDDDDDDGCSSDSDIPVGLYGGYFTDGDDPALMEWSDDDYDDDDD